MIQIVDKQNCCGCGACAQRCPQQCISMRIDQEGFLYPHVDESFCVNCGLCESVCPFLKPEAERTPLEVFAAINRDEGVRQHSSSGGVFSLLASSVISAGGVVFGVRFDEQWNVVFDYAEDKDKIGLFRGSKYVQANVGDAYKKCECFLKEGRKVLFSGTPCQISGLKKYLQKEYTNLVACDLICHGVPSPKVWEKYLFSVRKRKMKKNAIWWLLAKVPFGSSGKRLPFITGIRFRDKSNSWKRYRFVLELKEAPAEGMQSPVLSSTKTINELFYVNAYMKAFLHNLSLRPSCYHCKSKCGRSNSDITLADFWGIQNVSPEMDDDKGTSLVLVYNDKGTTLLNNANVLKKKTFIKDSLRDNLMWSECASSHPERELFFARLDKCKDVQDLICQFLKPAKGRLAKK